MDDTNPKKPSFPNADQIIPGVTGENRPQPEQPKARPTVNILDALDTQKREDDDLQRIHTYQEDIASAVKNDNVTMIKMALAEKKRQERQASPMDFTEEKSPVKKYVVIGAIVLVILFVIAGAVVFAVKTVGGNTPVSNDQPVALPPLLYTESHTVISTANRDSDDVIRLVRRELDTPPELGSMRAILLTAGTGTSTREITTREFLQGLQTHASSFLVNSLEPHYMLGLYAFSPADFFIIMKVNSYDTAFAEMLQWEPDIENDLGPIMITRRTIAPITVLTQATTTASSTTSVPPQEGGRIWIDRVVNNKDARVLVDAAGNPAMLYTFLDKETLVIASSDKALKEVMFRLTAGRITR